MAERSQTTSERAGERGGDRVLLLLSGDRDGELLEGHLEEHHEVVVDAPEAEWGRFDLCVVDAATYRTVKDDLAARKREAATYLPVLLLVPDRDRSRRTEWIAEELEGTLDDVLVVPAPRHELDARVEALLRARRQARTLALYRRTMDEATLGITIADATRPDTPIVYANERFLRLAGYGREAVLGRNWRFLHGPDTDEAAVRELREAVDAAEPASVEFLAHRADGTSFWNRMTVAPIRNEDGAVTYHLGFHQDVTDRIERERELERAVDLLERTQELANVGGWEIDIESGTVRWTDQVRRIRELPLDYEPGFESAIEFYHPEDRPVVREAIRNAIDHGEPYDLELRTETAEGDSRWVRTLGERHRKDGRTVLRGTIQDITERKERERDLRRYETIVETTSEPIYVLDTDGRFTRVNDAMVEASGHSREELIGSHVSVVTEQSDIEEAETLVRELLDEGRDRATIEAPLVAADGSRRQYAVSMSVLREDGEFVGTVGVAHDVTDLREHQRRLSVLDRVLRHNLRNKMNLVLGHAEELAAASDTPTAEAAEVIQRAASDLLELSNSAREFESVVGGDTRTTKAVDVASRVSDVVAAARLEHPAADVSTALPDEAPARVHETFDLAVEELVENAIVHSDRAHPTVEVSVTVAPDAVEVRVADDGPGIDEIDRTALVRGTESPLEHTQGLGLWLVRWSVESAGGEFDIAGNDPRGTVVTARFPRAAE